MIAICQNAGEDRNHAKRPAEKAGPRSPWLCATCRRGRKRAQSAQTKVKRQGRVYGLTLDDLEALVATQPLNFRGEPVCPICERATGRAKALATDHCHDRERAGMDMRDTIRGRLCGPCNQLIGRYRPADLIRALIYLLDPPAPGALNSDYHAFDDAHQLDPVLVQRLTSLLAIHVSDTVQP